MTHSESARVVICGAGVIGLQWHIISRCAVWLRPS